LTTFVNNKSHRVRGVAPGAQVTVSGERADELAQYLPSVDSDDGRAVLDAQRSAGDLSTASNVSAAGTHRDAVVDATAAARALGARGAADRLVGDGSGATEPAPPGAAVVNSPSVGQTTAAVVKSVKDRIVAAGPGPGRPAEGGPYDTRVNPQADAEGHPAFGVIPSGAAVSGAFIRELVDKLPDSAVEDAFANALSRLGVDDDAIDAALSEGLTADDVAGSEPRDEDDGEPSDDAGTGQDNGSGNGQSGGVKEDYESTNKADLEKLVKRRKIEDQVHGTGSKGAVTAEDLRRALIADDEKSA
jgi:hypothetical protein